LARTQSERYPEVRKNILRQAARLFAEQGYAGTTIIDLADACDSSRGALYHYFESKEDILFHILDGHVKDLLDRVEAAAGKVAEPLDQLRAIIAAIVLTNADSVHEQVVLLNHLKQLNVDQQKAIEAKERSIIDLVADLLIRIDSQRRLTTRTKKAYTMMIFGIVNYTFTWYNPKGPVPPAEYAEMAADLFIRGFMARD
jgi:AcrR family transcriptional regulator